MWPDNDIPLTKDLMEQICLLYDPERYLQVVKPTIPIQELTDDMGSCECNIEYAPNDDGTVRIFLFIRLQTFDDGCVNAPVYLQHIKNLEQLEQLYESLTNRQLKIPVKKQLNQWPDFILSSADKSKPYWNVWYKSLALDPASKYTKVQADTYEEAVERRKACCINTENIMVYFTIEQCKLFELPIE